MYVFRAGRKTISGNTLRNRLVHSLHLYFENPAEDTCIAALIAAGELECAFADVISDSADSESVGAVNITDRIAESLVTASFFDANDLLATATSLQLPDALQLSVAEGFAYYALHPQKFIDLARTLSPLQSARVIGLRSIGTTLSAVFCAALRARGVAAERITVRPHGHPYERQFSFNEREVCWLRSSASEPHVFVVDEGPGISGSSFLSVAEAAEHAGVSRDRIWMLGSRWPDPALLRAPNAADRWSRYHFRAVAPAPVLPSAAAIDLGGGSWRSAFPPDCRPAIWSQLESAKYMSVDGRRRFKFHGYGHYGETIAARAANLAASGFAPPLLALEKGFGVYDFIPGRSLTPSDISPELLHRLAEYCAFRAREFRSDEISPELSTMAAWNWQCEFGAALAPPLTLDVQTCVVTDSRMLPHEWLRADDGRILKFDAVSHGDDHFFPGPCDIAWDLAGAVIEFRMDTAPTVAFLAHYQHLSGDDPRDRLPDYLLAYSVFRMAWSKMASQSCAGTPDEILLRRDYLHYRSTAQQLAESRTAHRQIAHSAD
jgi:hypothetical protein